MRVSKGIVAAIGAFGLLAAAVPARATPVDFITAYGWVTTNAITSSATGATAASLGLPTCHNGLTTCTTGNADITFTTSGVNFSTNYPTNSSLTLSMLAWAMTNPNGINNVVDNSGGALINNTIWFFTGNISVTGTVATPQTFSVQHDDGATFIVNGNTVINAPGPTAPTVTTGSYTGGAGGALPFDLYYTECCGGPAVLNIGLLAPENAPVPEPASMLLLGTGVIGAGIRRWRKR